MNSQLLTKINTFARKRLIEFTGIIVIFIGFFLLISIFTYSPSDPNFIYTPEAVSIKNIGGFYGSVIADFFLQAIGLISILLTFTLLSWGYKIFSKKTINNISLKLFYTISYIIFGTTFINISFN